MSLITINRGMAEIVKAELEAIPLTEFQLLPDTTYRNGTGFRAKKALEQIGKDFGNVYDALVARHAYGRILMQPNCGKSTHNLVMASLNELIVKLHDAKLRTNLAEKIKEFNRIDRAIDAKKYELPPSPPTLEEIEAKADWKRAYDDLKADWDYQQTKIADYDRIKMELHDQNRNMERVLAQNSFIVEQYKNIEKHSKQYVSELKKEIDMLRAKVKQWA